jgi:hypothetical protein
MTPTEEQVFEPSKKRTQTKSSRKSRHPGEREGEKAAEDESSERTKLKLIMPKSILLVTISILENVLDGVTARKDKNPRTRLFFFPSGYIYVARNIYYKLKLLNSCAIRDFQ